MIDNHDSNARATFQVAVRAFHCCLKSVEHFSIPLFFSSWIRKFIRFQKKYLRSKCLSTLKVIFDNCLICHYFHNVSNSDALLQKTNSLVKNRSLMISVAFNFFHIQVSISSKNLRFWLTTFSFVYFVGFTG